VKRPYTLFVLPALAVIVLDQVSKQLVLLAIPVHQGFAVIDGLFSLVHVRNRGMAFGFMNRPGFETGSFLLMAVTLLAVLFLIFWFMRLRPEERRMTLSLSLIAGGALGNLLDRVRLGEVIDFLDFHIGSLHWPAFNVADSAITVGTLWLALQLLLQPSTPPPYRKSAIHGVYFRANLHQLQTRGRILRAAASQLAVGLGLHALVGRARHPGRCALG
jgi:signal peptidase II